MYRHVLGIGLALGLAAPALAADLPTRKPAIVPILVAAPFNWTGFYVGANVGYGWGVGDRVGLRTSTLGFLGDYGTLNTHGVFGGAQIGYNHQFGMFVAGLEADFQASGLSDSSGPNSALGFTVTGSSKQRWFGTVRPRLGVAFDRFLVYATGGLAYGDTRYTVTATVPGAAAVMSRNDTRVGWTVGGGVEYAFTQNWSVKAEYLYTQYEQKRISAPFVTTGGVVTAVTASTVPTLSNHSARVGVNYRF